MHCLAPILIPDKVLASYGIKNEGIFVPCGHCSECARDRRNDWFVRLWTVYNDCKAKSVPVWFFTATIDPKLWPGMNSKNPDVADRVSSFVRSWNERLRYLNGGSMPLRFMCSEYGSCDRDYVDKNGTVRVTTGALHFHGLLFGNLPLDRLLSGFRLSHGHVDIDLIRGPEAIRYTVKYCTKDYSIADPRLRARVFCSPGIGDPSFYFGDSLPTPTVLINGFHYRTPRYFIDKQVLRYYGREAFKDVFGTSVVVRANAERRLDAYYDRCRFFDSLCDVDDDFKKYLLDRFFSRQRKPISFEKLCYLRSIHLVGSSHPFFRLHDQLSSFRSWCSLLCRDRSFVNYSPLIEHYFKLNQFSHERHQTFLPLSFDFET